MHAMLLRGLQPCGQLANVAAALRRPALHIYSWLHTALRGLVTRQQTLTASLHEFIQAYKQKDLAEVSPCWLAINVNLTVLQ